MPELYKDVTEGWNLIGPTPSETNTEQSISYSYKFGKNNSRKIVYIVF